MHAAMTLAMIEECAEWPGDDAPRLVYADAVGGERGELVVVQCDLARGGLTVPEAVARRQRERALLDRHGVAWAGSLAAQARCWSFRRGFVEAAAFDRLDETRLSWMSEHPLLDSLTIPAGILRDVPPSVLFELRGLFLEAPLPAGFPQLLADIARRGLLRELCAFGIEQLEPDGVDAVIEVLDRATVQQLWLPRHGLADPGELLAHARHVVALDLRSERSNLQLAPGVLAMLRELPLRALRIDRVDRTNAAAIARLLLESLGASIEFGANLARVRTLEVYGGNVLGSARLDSLRVLRLHSRATDPTTLAERVAQLELLDLRAQRPDQVPGLGAGEVLTDHALDGDPDNYRTELLHRDAHAMFVKDTTCRKPHGTAWIARLDRQRRLWAVPDHRPSAFGRILDCDYRIDEDCVSRMQARLTPRDGRFVLQELGSTQGVVLDGTPVTGLVDLVDGAELIMGFVVLRFFAGDGAHERARAAVEEARRIDPVTRLPWTTRGHQLAVDWTQVSPRPDARERTIALRELAHQLVEKLGGAGTLGAVDRGHFAVEPPRAAAALRGRYRVAGSYRETIDLDLE